MNFTERYLKSITASEASPESIRRQIHRKDEMEEILGGLDPEVQELIKNNKGKMKEITTLITSALEDGTTCVEIQRAIDVNCLRKGGKGRFRNNLGPI